MTCHLRAIFWLARESRRSVGFLQTYGLHKKRTAIGNPRVVKGAGLSDGYRVMTAQRLEMNARRKTRDAEDLPNSGKQPDPRRNYIGAIDEL
jgi:hypothetical protein